MKRLLLVMPLLLSLTVPGAFAGKRDVRADAARPTVVGSGQSIQVIPNLAEATPAEGRLVWRHSVVIKEASFLKAHLVNVNLRPGDVLRLRSATGKVVEEIERRGPKDLGSFWALSAFGEELHLEFSFQREYPWLPFRIDEVIVGDPGMFETPRQGPESICSPEDFDDVICYQSDAGKWANVMASVGLMNVGANPSTGLWCSGSNVSPQNYLLTNNHCITTQSDCNNTEFVFKYYRTGCNNGSPPTADWQSFRCDVLEVSSPFVSCDQGLGDLDFSLCSVLGDPTATFGAVTVDPIPLTDGEAIYIVQHPAGRPHEITHGSGADVDVDGTVLRYYNTLDTEGGSSGSPIYRDADDKMVGLHHCGGCSTPGTGNRGMLMSDIYPLIQSYLCTSGLDVTAQAAQGVQEVSGNGNGLMEPGETWEFTPVVLNTSCGTDALNVTADIQLNPASVVPVTLFSTTASFGTVAAGQSKPATAAIQFEVGAAAPCGGTVILDLVNIQATNGGPFADALQYVAEPLGFNPLTVRFDDDFAGGLGAWTVIDGGTGTGAASTWTTANPGGRSILTPPFVIADSDALGTGQTMDEELISPVLDLSGFGEVTLQFNHDFNWYSGGLDEQGDVDVRSSATGGSWVTVQNYSGGSATGNVMIDISAEAAGQSDVEIRFHYYNASYEWWWALDDIFVLGSRGYICPLFSADFETGNLGQWHFSTGPGISVVQPGLNATANGLAVTTDGTSRRSWVQSQQANEEGTFYFRIYLDANGAAVGSAGVDFVRAYGERRDHIRLSLADSGGHGVTLSVADNAGSFQTIGTAAIPSSGQVMVEVEWLQATSGANGEARLYVDGILQGQATNLDNGQQSISAVRVGLPGGSLGASLATFYLDEYLSTR